MNSNGTTEDTMYGYFTTDDHLTGDQLEYAAVKEAEEKTAARAADVYTAHRTTTPTNVPYVAAPVPAAAYSIGDVVTSPHGPGKITDAKWVATVLVWTYTIDTATGSRFVREHLITEGAV